MARLLLGGSAPPRRIIDPSAGAGGLLIAVLQELLRAGVSKKETLRHVQRLHGVELDPVARELACLMIWLTAGEPSVTPSLIGQQVVVGNAITREWWSAELFDALIMNPPWESLRERSACVRTPDAVARKQTLKRLLHEEVGHPDLPPIYSAHGRGDRNLFKAFTELAPHLLADGGRITALLPGAWSSDLGTAPLRRLYLSQLRLERWTSFENRRGYFPIDGRYKFGVLVGERTSAGTDAFGVRGFALEASDMQRRHTSIRRGDLGVIGGAAESIPDVTSSVERRMMIEYRRRGVGLFALDGPFGSVRYRREIDLTEDRKRGEFHRIDQLDAAPRRGGFWATGDGRRLVPLVEGRMISQYDFFAKTWVEGSGRTARWSWSNGHRLRECRPQYLIEPKPSNEVRIAICDVTSATNTRTVLASWVPPAWPCGNTAPVLIFASERYALAALAVLNSMVFDWFARRVVAGLHLNRFYLDAMAWPRVDCPDIDLLAQAGALLTSLSPRYHALTQPRLSIPPLQAGFLEAHTLIEVTVAKGYKLSTSSLREVFSPSSSDRRGLWRHFVADPHASEIAQATLRSLGSTTPRQDILRSRDSIRGRSAHSAC